MNINQKKNKLFIKKLKNLWYKIQNKINQRYIQYGLDHKKCKDKVYKRWHIQRETIYKIIKLADPHSIHDTNIDMMFENFNNKGGK